MTSSLSSSATPTDSAALWASRSTSAGMSSAAAAGLAGRSPHCYGLSFTQRSVVVATNSSCLESCVLASGQLICPVIAADLPPPVPYGGGWKQNLHFWPLHALNVGNRWQTPYAHCCSRAQIDA